VNVSDKAGPSILVIVVLVVLTKRKRCNAAALPGQ